MSKTTMTLLWKLGRCGYISVTAKSREYYAARALADTMGLIEREMMFADGSIGYTYRISQNTIDSVKQYFGEE